MSLIVQKFGGSSVRDHEHLLRMARIVKGNVDRGDEVLVVLSAQGDTTDGLLQKAKEMSAAPSPRELDMLLSAGEQMSAALGAMALRQKMTAAECSAAAACCLNYFAHALVSGGTMSKVGTTSMLRSPSPTSKFVRTSLPAMTKVKVSISLVFISMPTIRLRSCATSCPSR